MSTDSLQTQRLAKVIARSGLASRREAERMIEDGKVKVNGQTVHHPGHPVTEADAILVDDQPLCEPNDLVYYALYKPRGYITSRHDPEERKSVTELFKNLPVRVEPVGRLDMDTEGILLLTNDGHLAHKLTHPSSNVPKRYMVKIWKTPDDKKLKRVRNGIKLEDGRTAPCKLRILDTTDTGNCWVEITVTEGRNRLIRRIFDAIGHPVSKLRRESFATVALRGMERGELRPLSGEEVLRLRSIARGESAAEAGHGKKYGKGFARPKSRPNKPLSRKKRQRKPGRSERKAGPRGRRQ
jgi:23S rRNA pseudouridine2605 synthase